jgi:hypothetical protein
MHSTTGGPLSRNSSQAADKHLNFAGPGRQPGDFLCRSQKKVTKARAWKSAAAMTAFAKGRRPGSTLRLSEDRRGFVCPACEPAAVRQRVWEAVAVTVSAGLGKPPADAPKRGERVRE